jgi:diaminopimelate epimerase
VALRFHKMHGAGNDFMLVDLRPGAQEGVRDVPGAREARDWGDRHRGVGFDQLLVLSEPTEDRHDARVSFWNADGSSAEQCGNGMRAIGLYLHRRAGERGNRTRFTVEAPLQTHDLEVQGPDSVSVDMGRPHWAASDIPLLGLSSSPNHRYCLALEGGDIEFGAVSLGNPHAVIEVERAEDAPLESIGAALRKHPAFPDGCNVGFAQVLEPDHITLRVLERGAGETLACGSGACAAVAWLTRIGRTQGRVRVTQAGGTLWVETEGGVGPVTLTGPATHVYEGTLA